MGQRDRAPFASRQPVLSDDLKVARIRARAYELWEQDGCPEGREQDHWLRAEREVVGTEAPNS